jgi:hypothetical protein
MTLAFLNLGVVKDEVKGGNRRSPNLGVDVGKSGLHFARLAAANAGRKSFGRR